MRIEGVFSGEIHSDSVLVIGEGASVSAQINVGTIIVNGEVRGDVRAKQGVEIRNPGRLLGNVQTPSLIIEKGVTFEGNCKMENLSASGGPPAFPKGDVKKTPPEDKSKNNP